MVVALALSACTRHQVGPARTFDDYERKSRTTAEDALSSVETVQLLATTAAQGDAFGPYTNVSISEQEDSLADVVGDYGSIQPPDAHADELRAQLDALLSSATDHVAAVRIAARRGTLAGLDQVAAPLAADSDALNAFLESLK
ncbi:MAG: hypothetical protein JWL72_2002 [Ilumatobacteraceae bacterium]|nr:hypothetical protein [Ilumatobacteraceae bacterium]MCU1388664.1 hypothetical protein [Ilumatobacteraceae bacterium]